MGPSSVLPHEGHRSPVEKSPLEEAAFELSRNSSWGVTRVAGDRMGVGMVYSRTDLQPNTGVLFPRA